jgi:catechol 2,3-dioxygenase-like lactoylglutathione lyase family enzyme
MDVLFVAGVAVISSEPAASQALYEEALGLALEGDEYRSTSSLEGTKHFGIWPLNEAAIACFGTPEWPDDVPVPQATIEFEVLDVAAAAAELAERGFSLIHDAREEPWGQTMARLSSPEGLLVGLSYAPWFHLTE